MMKTNNKKKGNTAKKLIPAAMMLAVSASMLATSTYAWFTMNKDVTVTGMEVHTTVSSNLLISETNTANSYRNSLTQLRSALLEPVSTINGINFYYTGVDNVDELGNAITENYTAYNEDTALTSGDTNADWANKTNYDDNFNQEYNISASATPAAACTNAYGYVDYTFYLKAVNNSSTDKDIKLTELNLLYDGAAVGNDNSWTAALIVDTATEGTAYSGSLTSAKVTNMYSMGTANFTANAAIGSYDDDNDNTTPNVVGTTALSYGSNVATYGGGTNVATVGANSVGCYYVTVRLWLEGENTNCKSSNYSGKTEGYTLDLKFELDTNTSAVSGITSTP